jgi:TetR/AcrR family transcriptional regulator, repressor for neighboring sulfatase
VAAVLAAAAELFAEKGPAATSVRDIAARSGVNHGLVYRHFGAKEELVAAVLDHLSDEVAATTGTGAGGGSALDAAVERHWRVIAWAILDGYPVGRLQRRFPYVSQLIDRARPHHPDDVAARLAAGNAVALELGWRLFEPFVRSATGTRDVPPLQLRESIKAAVTEMLEPSPGG